MPALQSFILNNLSVILAVFTALIIILFIWAISLQTGLSKFKKRNTELFTGKNIANLEDIIVKHSQHLKVFDKDIQELYNISNQINNLAFRSLHKVGMIRFNPFNDVGGDQSFSIALLNGKNNGLVITSLYTREGTRTYSKAIKAGISEKYPLTKEEEEAIKISLIVEPKKIN